MPVAGAERVNCSESSVCQDVIQLSHYDTCFIVCRSQPVSWSAAVNHCHSLDADLTPLLFDDLHEALLDNIATIQPPATEAEYWIGLRKARWIWHSTGIGSLTPKKVKARVLHGKSISELRGVSHMGSHNVTCHSTQANTPRLDPSQ